MKSRLTHDVIPQHRYKNFLYSFPKFFINICFNVYWGFPGGSAEKNLPAKARDAGSIPGLGKSLGEGNSNPLQHSFFFFFSCQTGNVPMS